MIKKILAMILFLLGLSACTANNAALPLVEGKPTLFFFYTEN